MKNKKNIGIMFLCVFMTLFAFTPIVAEEKSEIEEIADELRLYDVSEDEINNLIWKYENNVAWDSLSGEFPDIEPESTIVIGNYTQEITRYPDGSLSINDLYIGEKEEAPAIQPFDVSGGDFNWGSTGQWWSYTGAVARQNTILIKAEFKLDYSGHQNLRAEITKVYDYSLKVYGGSGSVDSLKITNRKATSSTPATAEFRFTHVLAGGGYSSTAYLKVLVYNRNNAITQYSY